MPVQRTLSGTWSGTEMCSELPGGRQSARHCFGVGAEGNGGLAGSSSGRRLHGPTADAGGGLARISAHPDRSSGLDAGSSPRRCRRRLRSVVRDGGFARLVDTARVWQHGRARGLTHSRWRVGVESGCRRYDHPTPLSGSRGSGRHLRGRRARCGPLPDTS